MSKLYPLLKITVQNSSLVHKMIYEKNPKERSKARRMGILVIVVGLLILGLSFFYSWVMAQPLKEIGMLEVLLAVMIAAACIIMLITTIYKINGLVFRFKDYDMLMSMPIPTNTIVVSRLLVLYFYNLLFTAIVMVPAWIIYGIYAAPSWGSYIYFFVGMILLPLVPVVISSIIGCIVGIVAAKLRHKNLVSILLTLVFLLAIMALSFQMSYGMGSTMNHFASIGPALQQSILASYPLAGLFLQGVCALEFGPFLLYAAISLALFAIYIWAMSRIFKKLNTWAISVQTKKNFVMKKAKGKSGFTALYHKELRRFFASSTYVVNTSFGMILLLIASVAAVIFGREQIQTVLPSEFLPQVGWLIPMAMSFLVAMTCTTACSISLEGKSIWITKILPVREKSILLSKIAVNFTLIFPALLICSVLLSVVFATSVVQGLCMFLVPAAYGLFVSIFGLYLNLKMPNFQWKSEVTVVKQSAPMMVVVFSSMILSFVPIGMLIAGSSNPQGIVIGSGAVMLFLALISIVLVVKKGPDYFRRLG